MIWAGLGLQLAVFALWVWLMARSLLRLARWTRAQSGAMLPGPRWGLRGFAAFLRAPDFAAERRQLGLVTVALFGILLLNRVLFGS